MKQWFTVFLIYVHLSAVSISFFLEVSTQVKWENMFSDYVIHMFIQPSTYFRSVFRKCVCESSLPLMKGNMWSKDQPWIYERAQRSVPWCCAACCFMKCTYSSAHWNSDLRKGGCECGHWISQMIWAEQWLNTKCILMSYVLNYCYSQCATNNITSHGISEPWSSVDVCSGPG